MSRLGQLLLKRSVITAEQLHAAVTDQRRHGCALAASLVRLGILSDHELTACLHKEYRLPVVDARSAEPEAEVLRLIPAALARKHGVLPLGRTDSTLTVAVADPANLVGLNEVKFLSGCDVRPVLASARSLQTAIERLYGKPGAAYAAVLAELEAAGPEPASAAEDASVDAESSVREDAALVVKLVNALMAGAIDKRASDIHVEPYEKDVRVRFRIDGVLHDILQAPFASRNALISRIKIMASLDIAERRRPQDGAIQLRLPGLREATFRVSVLPTVFGEKVVLRLFDKSHLRVDMTKLGFEREALEQFRSAIARPFGMVLVTGPTGSGKSTTLYSALVEINDSSRNISTCEDPVELTIRGINQVQINDEIGLTFAAALRSFLRQDPDVIMVGEVRDGETAGIAVKAALTGHTVLSTVHTNDSSSTINRLLDMGVEPFLVASSVNLIVAQRLARLICPYCKITAPAYPAETLREVGFGPAGSRQLSLAHGAGCNECTDTGYRGRVGLYEVLPISDEIREMILRRASVAEIKRVAVAQGMKTLRESGFAKVREGLTTIEEVVRVTGGD